MCHSLAGCDNVVCPHNSIASKIIKEGAKQKKREMLWKEENFVQWYGYELNVFARTCMFDMHVASFLEWTRNRSTYVHSYKYALVVLVIRWVHVCFVLSWFFMFDTETLIVWNVMNILMTWALARVWRIWMCFAHMFQCLQLMFFVDVYELLCLWTLILCFVCKWFADRHEI